MFGLANLEIWDSGGQMNSENVIQAATIDTDKMLFASCWCESSGEMAITDEEGSIQRWAMRR